MLSASIMELLIISPFFPNPVCFVCWPISAALWFQRQLMCSPRQTLVALCIVTSNLECWRRPLVDRHPQKNGWSQPVPCDWWSHLQTHWHSEYSVQAMEARRARDWGSASFDDLRLWWFGLIISSLMGTTHKPSVQWLTQTWCQADEH